LKEKYFPAVFDISGKASGVKTLDVLKLYGTSELVPCYESFSLRVSSVTRHSARNKQNP
jgi:hypothetical protein